jgi:DNA-binding transcriptional LysR family regulator
MAHRTNWEDLQFILSVAKGGSLSAAARHLGVNHTTIMRHVKEFESTYQVKLFEHRATGYVLTFESRHILASLTSIESSVAALEHSIRGDEASFEGRIRLTSTDAFCRLILPRHIVRLHQDYPQIELDLSSSNNRLDLARMDADITIRPAVSIPDDLVGEKICSLAFKVYGSKSYLSINRQVGIKTHSWLGVSETLTNSPVGAWQNENVSDSIIFRADSFLSLRDAAEEGMGLAILPCFVGDLSDILVPVTLNTGVWVAAHMDLAGSPPMRSLLTWFAEALNEDIPLLSGELSSGN